MQNIWLGNLTMVWFVKQIKLDCQERWGLMGVLEMFKRSEEIRSLRFISFVGDGDSSMYQTVSNRKPYEAEVAIIKKKCVGHVQKRLCTRLRKLKTTYPKGKLADGRAFDGRGRLTKKMVDTMQNYYGLDICKEE